ncbi:MAG: tetraacyldisaccharide 4'-kinase [Candidatus Omnitrophota bacterium]|nr:MAG: tetraacyldisaccharide 4'-kinase [Candidatus Omnitrophota bacterium]
MEFIFYCILVFLSFLYGFIVAIRNSLYDRGILKSFSLGKVISIGNISWAGSGKTTLAMRLYEKLTGNAKIAILRRGYGCDEGKLLKQITGNVYSCVDRVRLAKRLASDFDLFILDDGFQYRKLRRDVNIVVMGAREFKNNFNLIPANFFREPLNSLRRAQIVVLNYANELEKPKETKEFLLNKFRHLKVFFARYKLKRFIDLNGNEYTIDYLKKRKLAALSATGYPEGFFNTLRELNLNISGEIIYPDHYELNREEFTHLSESLHKQAIHDIIVTAKDKYHLPRGQKQLNVYIMEIEMAIENEEEFLKEIISRIKKNV